MRFLRLLPITFALLIQHCDDKDSETTDVAPTPANQVDDDGFSTGTLSLQVQLVATSGPADSQAALRLAEPTDANAKYYHTNSIISGAPDVLTVYVTKMALVRKDPEKGEEAEAIIFNNEEGKPLRITGSTVDMSQFFTKIQCYAEDGTILDEPCPCGLDKKGKIIKKVEIEEEDGTSSEHCPELEDGEEFPFAVVNVDQTGTFDQLSVSFRGDAQVSGCVEGYIRGIDYDKSDDADYTNNVNWERYCTKKGKGSDKAEGGTGNPTADFLATDSDSGEETVVYLAGDKTLDKNGSYVIKGDIKLTDDGDAPQITMVIDTSTMLRFFKKENSDDKTKPDGGFDGYGGSYFFLNRFTDQNFVFVGRAGHVQGYAWTLDGLRIEDNETALPTGADTDPTLYTCTLGTTCDTYSSGWLSVIFDPDGDPMLFSLQPNDNNKPIKIANKSKDGIDPSALSTDTGTLTKFEQSATDANDEKQTMKIYRIDLESAVGTKFGSHFYEFKDRTKTASDGDEKIIEHYGVLHFERKL